MKLSISREHLAQYTYIKSANRRKKISGHYPDFLIVGPQRTGTTWLVANLNQHPEIFLSYPKELYFFNRLLLAQNKYSRHYYAFDWDHLKSRPQKLIREVGKILYFDFYKTGRFNANELEWYLSFFSDDLFSRLYKHMKMLSLYGQTFSPKVRGEATASYAILEEDLIQEIISLNPDLKAILMVRDPVKRAWSHAKKDLIRNVDRTFQNTEDEEFQSFFLQENQIKNGSYIKNINKWSSLLKEDNLFVGFYEDIKSRPKDFLIDLFGFLGVDTDSKYVSVKAEKVINKTGKERMPEQYQEMLEQIYSKEKAELSRTFNRARF